MRRALCFLAALCLFAVPAFPATGGEIVAICDRNVAPYRALLESFTKASPSPVRVMAPAEAGGAGFEERLEKEGARAVLAVGLQARAAVEGLRRLPVLLAMAPQAEPWVGARPNRLGIEMALSPRRNLETMRRVFPRARRVGVLFDPAQTGGYVREAQEAAGALGLTLVASAVDRPADLPGRLDELRGQADVLWLLPDPTVLGGENLNTLLLASFQSRVPLYAFARKYVELGAVAAAHLDPAALGAQAGGMIPGRGGAGPAARWQYAAGVQLVVNQKVARKLGVDLDDALLESADDVLR